MKKKFTHLHVHSHYSLLDGLAKIDNLLDYTKELGMDSLALTDHGVLYGAVEFFQKAKQRGIKPIIGCEVYVALDKMTDRRPGIDDKRYHLVLLVKNETGYKNLVKLVSKGHLEGFYYKPRIDEEILEKHSEGLIALSACLNGKIPRLILSNKLDEAKKTIVKYKEIFGEDFYLELQHHTNIPDQQKVNKALIELSRQFDVPLVATNDIHYLRKEDADAQDLLMLINTGADSDDPERISLKWDDYSMLSSKEMTEFFKDIPEAIDNTQKIVEKCNFEFKFDEIKLPHFSVPNGKTPNEFLKEISFERAEKRFGEITDEIKERLDYELGVIDKTGFASYFLIVQDFVNWAKSKRIVVGPGRGCFLPDSKILLKDGRQKNIQDIKKGERVISHKGNKRKVKKVLSYDVDEEIAIIKSKVPFFDLKLTKDHKVLAIKHKMCSVSSVKKTICKPSCIRSCSKNSWRDYKLQWVKAKDLKTNDFLVYPNAKRRQIHTTFDLLHFNNLDANLKGDDKYVWYEIGSNKLIQKKVKRFIKLDEYFARLLGFFLSEGWSQTIRKRRECRLGFGFHKNEKEYIAQVKELLCAVFGLESSIIPHKTKNSCQIIAYSRIVAKFLEILGGKYSKNKHIPYQIFGSSDEIIIALLSSLFQGDGSRKEQMRISYDSTSFNLVSQIKMLLLGFGIMSSIKVRHYKQKNWNSSYKLTISGEQLFRFNRIFKEFQIPIKKQKFYRNDTFIWKNYFCFPVKEVLFKKYKGKVFDLTLEKDGSYVANDITVHNSAAGSLVSYCLGITSIDPLKFNLLFERFLNLERISKPDIDLDFADRRRDEVIEYVREKYGRENVAQIITFGTMTARAVIRDVGRALKYPYSYCDKMAKLVPIGKNLNECLQGVVEFKQLYETDIEAKKLIDFAKKLEGVARHASTHACGVVISQKPLTDLVSLQTPSQYDNSIITQYEMKSIESLGLLKMDFLGLKNLTIIEETLARIYKIRGKNINIEKIPLDDKEAFVLLQKAETTGVFQLESGGMKRHLRELNPSVFEDIIAMVALYRPGPMELIPEFIARKHGKKQIEYLHPKLEPILKDTYGICIYQEQLLKIAQEMAGFTLGEADVLRAAVGKKIKELLLEQHGKFINGCIKKNISQEIAEQLWQWILPFAKYGFNRSHATSYAMIAFQTAYLKAHYPLEFMASLLTSESGDIERISILIKECQKMGIEVLPPDINESYRFFSVVLEDNKIRFGLFAIKNVGENVVNLILEERKNNGPFKSIEDLVKRVDPKALNKRPVESLIKSGAFDKFGERGEFLNNLEKILEFGRQVHKIKLMGQKNLFDVAGAGDINKGFNSLKLDKSEKISKREKLEWEKNLLGLYLSGHPLDSYKDILKKNVTLISEIKTRGSSNMPVKLAGIISSIKKIITKTGKTMLFVQVEDFTDKIEIIAFPSIVERNPLVFVENKIIILRGKISGRDHEKKVICEDIQELLDSPID